MPNDLFKRVLYNNGEGADVQDFNNDGGYAEARLLDQVLRSVSGNARSTAPASPLLRGSPSAAPFLYALGGGQGYIVPGAGARETTVRAGTILQQVGSPSGNEASFLPYTMIDAEFTLTHAIGDATNPRVDVIEVKLEYVDGNSESRIIQDPPPSTLQSVQTVNKKRRIQATFQIVQGTPAATPAYPTLTSGFAAIGAVVVPATHNAVFVAETHYVDLRIPLGVRRIRTLGPHFAEEVASAWTFSNDGVATDAMHRAALLASLGPASLFIPSPLGPHHRLVGIGVVGRLQYSALTARLLRVDATDGAVADVVLGDISASLPSSATPTATRLDMSTIESAVATTSGNAKNAAGLGTGIWGSGHRSGPTGESVATDMTTLGLELRVTTGGSDLTIIGAIDWYVADGLI